MWWALLLACSNPPDSSGALADQCTGCHINQATQHAQSAHGQAAESSLFQALRAEAEARQGLSGAARCDQCHAPEVGSEQGLSCISCHAAIGNQRNADGLLVHDLDRPVQGPTGLAPHQVEASAFLSDSALCGTCHDQTLDAGFAESPYQHWLDSPAAEQGQRCQDCHMKPVGGAADHRPPGLSDPDDAQRLLEDSVSLTLTRESNRLTVRLTNLNPGHRLPDGASFLRALWVDLEDPTGPLAQWRLDTQLLDESDTEVVLPFDAVRQHDRSIGPLQTVQWQLEQSEPRIATACVRFQAVRSALSEQVGLPESPVRDILCVQEDLTTR